MRIEWVRGADGLADLAGPWDALTASDDDPFADHAWFTAWWEAFGEGELRIACAWDGGELAAAFPLAARRPRRLVALSNYHSPLFRPPARDGAALSAVIEAARGAASELHVHALPAGHPAFAALTRGTSFCEAVHASPIVETGGDLTEYLRGVSSTVKRRRRKLEREHEAAFRFDDGGEDLEADLAAGYLVEAAGWKGQAGTAINASPQTEAFYTNLARAYRARGEFAAQWLHVDGAPAAWNYCLVRGGRVFMLKTGFDEALRSHAPGLVLNLWVVEQCFERPDTVAYELLGDAEEWKLKFATTRREHVRLWAWRRRPVPLAGYAFRVRVVPLLRAARRRAEARRTH